MGKLIEHTIKKIDERFKILEPLDEAINRKRREYNDFVHTKNVWGIDGKWYIKTKSKKVEEKFYRLQWEIGCLYKTKDILIKHIKNN